MPRAALARSDGDPILGLLIAGRYAVLELRGAGALATVYRARDFALGQDVALKIVRADRLIDPVVRERFVQEARILCALRSPYTAAAHGWGVIEDGGPGRGAADGGLYLAMELLEGESLGARLGRVGRLEPAVAVRFACHCLRSLVEAHGMGIVHRDLKPDNLLLVGSATGAQEVCRVIDFGLAATIATGVQAAGPPPSVRALGASGVRGSPQGTPRYMSPEQAAGLAVDARTDLYSLGVVLYHMLAGRPPFIEREASTVIAHHLRTPPPPLRQVAPEVSMPSELVALVMRTLAKEPAQRPNSANVLLQALERLRPSLGAGWEGDGPGSGPLRGGPRAGGRRWAMLVLGVGGVGGVLVAAAVSIGPCASGPAPDPGEPSSAVTAVVSGLGERAGLPAGTDVGRFSPGPQLDAGGGAAPPAAGADAAAGSVVRPP